MLTTTALVPAATLPFRLIVNAWAVCPVERLSRTRVGVWPVKAAPWLVRYQPARSMRTWVVTLLNTHRAPLAPRPEVARLATLVPAPKLSVDDVGAVAPQGYR